MSHISQTFCNSSKSKSKSTLSPSRVEKSTWVIEEPETFIDMNIYSNKLGLQNPKLAQKLMKAILLPKDWEETKSCHLCKITSSFYPTLLKVSLFFFNLTYNIICCSLLMKWLWLKRASENLPSLVSPWRIISKPPMLGLKWPKNSRSLLRAE